MARHLRSRDHNRRRRIRAGEKSSKRAQRIFRGARLGFLVFFLVLATTAGILHQFVLGTKPVGVDALCPFGGIEAAFTLALTGGLLAKIAWSSFILLAATIVVALVFRRAFCGTICAFGALQELFGRLGKAIFRKRLTVPAAIDKPARYVKYLMLIVIVVLSVVTGQLIIRPYDPWAAWNHLLSVELISGFLIDFIILIASLVGSILYNRFFCEYLLACDEACPVNIPVESLAQVQSAECIAVFAGSLIGIVPWTQAFNPDDIKGSVTFESVSKVTGIPMEAFIAAFGITPEEFAKPIKDSAHNEGSTFDTEAVRELVRGKLK